MKIGDKFPVAIAGHDVGHARVVSMREGVVELKLDVTRAVMAYRTELDAPAVKETTSHVMLGTEEPAQPVVAPVEVVEATPVETPAAPVQPLENPAPAGPVVDNPGTTVPSGPGEASEPTQS